MCHSPCGDIGCLPQLASTFSVYVHECFSVHAQILMKDGVCISADFPQQQLGMCAENPTVSNLDYCFWKICHSCRKERKWWNQRGSTTEVPSHLFLIFSHKSLYYTDNTCRTVIILFQNARNITEETTSGSKVSKVRLLVTDILINMVQGSHNHSVMQLQQMQMQSRCMLLLHDQDWY